MQKAGGTPRSLADRWAHFNDKQLNWAFDAYEQFLKSLSPEIRERLGHKEESAEAYVVIFGQTQVGKTTLLLDLIGIEAESMERVSQVLRGGRPEGQSATATAMEYRRAPDNRWGLKSNETNTCWFIDDQEMLSALGNLREMMEHNQLNLLEPCTVSIPANCFCQDAEQPTVRMLDLPGDNPANDVEQQYVHEMASKYVPLADLILLVGKGDGLDFLKPGNLTLPGIEDWQSAPRRFRIITTHHFSLDTVSDDVLKNNCPADAEYYRKRLIEQIEKSTQLSEEAKRTERYFPLELVIDKLPAAVKQLVTPMVNTLKRQLLGDIKASTTSTARLHGALDAHLIIGKFKESRLNEIGVITAELEDQLNREKANLDSAKLFAEKSKKKYIELNRPLKNPANSMHLV